MPKIISVYNPTNRLVEADLNGVVVRLEDNSCIDLSEESAKKFLALFPQLVVQGEQSSPETPKVEPDAPVPADGKTAFEQGLQKGEKFFCSLCDKEFKNMPGLRSHQRAHERAGNP